MKRTPIALNPKDFPYAFRSLIAGAEAYDSSCSSEARVIFIDRDGGMYLKSATRGALAREAEMAQYFHQKGLTGAVLDYFSDERDWLLTARVSGEDCTHADYLAAPARLCDLLAERLRVLHDTDGADCPVQNRMDGYFATAEDNYRRGVYDLSYFTADYGDATADEAIATVREGRTYFRNDTLLHGDYCLPNIMLDDWRFSGFIDLGNGGMGDRHVDLYWGAWTLRFNLKTDAYRERFFDAYGREKITPELLRVVAAAEVFG